MNLFTIKHLSIYFIGLILIGITGMLALALIFNQPGAGLNKQGVDFMINPGESAYLVAQRLSASDYIKSETWFKIMARFDHNGGVQKGLYELSEGESAYALYKIFKTGQQKMIDVTLPEGLTLHQTAQKISTTGLTSQDEFLDAASRYLKTHSQLFPDKVQSLEGYLYPDTYKFPALLEADLIVKTMVEHFFEVMKALGYENNKGQFSLESWYESLILASIVEKEYKDKNEAAIIASVFKNRLERGMRLQSCATIVYVLTEEYHRAHPSRLYYVDLRLDSPFNSYINDGLPPAPICSPSKIAIEAALNPSKTDYFYFVVKDLKKGTHSFSSSLQEHNKSKKDYISLFLN